MATMLSSLRWLTSLLLLGVFVQLPELGTASTISSPASIFNLPLSSNSAKYTFAVNVPDGSSDFYFHLSGPADYSWIAVGTGSEMANSLMVVIYSNADGSNVTVSPRLSMGEQEPVYASSLAVDLLDGTGIFNGSMTVNARCSNCTSWATGSLDLHSTSQSWIFGLGPTGGTAAMLRSNSKTASIERHSLYGSFTMDMVHATGGSGGLPASYISAVGTSLGDGVSSDSNWPSIIHALCLCGALIVLMPTGVVFLRISPKSVRWHWLNQSLATVIAIIGIFIGFYLSTMFTKSQSYGSAHQILGILILLAVVAQWGMGYWHHYMYKKTHAPTKLGPMHRYFGYVIFFGAILNGGIGLTWSYASNAAVIGYSVAVAILGLAIAGIFGWSRWSLDRAQKGHSKSPFELRTFGRSDSSDIYHNGESGGAHGYYNDYNNYDRL